MNRSLPALEALLMHALCPDLEILNPYDYTITQMMESVYFEFKRSVMIWQEPGGLSIDNRHEVYRGNNSHGTRLLVI